MTTTLERTASRGKLPPGQRRIEGFPRFGTHLGRPAPAIPPDFTITIRGAGIESFEAPLAALTDLPRRELNADFHCVSGWSATNLRWEGVPFSEFYRSIIAPAIPAGVDITHLVFRGLDGFRSVVLLEDALDDGVILAEHLDGLPLDTDHGAPVRLVSPDQYGYVSTKHLCRVEVHSGEPPTAHPGGFFGRLLMDHPRARVWEEERHGLVPGRVIRPLYRALKAPVLWLCTRGTRRN